MNLLRLLGLKRRKPPKPSPNAAFEYGTHLPVLRSLVEVFHPRGVLELGAGKFSTPYFYHNVENVVSLENDPEWRAEVAKLLPPRERFSLIHHDVPGITASTRTREVTAATRDCCLAYYQDVIDSCQPLDLLFIDHVSGLRAPALYALHPRFDFVVYHDAEYRVFRPGESGTIDPGEYFHFVLRSYLPHTGVLFRRVLDSNALAYYTEHYRFDLRDVASPLAGATR
jgi:hypothetical protein